MIFNYNTRESIKVCINQFLRTGDVNQILEDLENIISYQIDREDKK